MIRFDLIDIARKKFPEFDISTKEGVSKLSKILNAELSLNGGFSKQELDELINFLYINGEKFSPLVTHKNISIILRGKGEQITFSPFRDNVSFQTITEFQAILGKNVLAYIKESIKQNNWNNIKSIFTNYPFIVSNNTKVETLKELSLKNKALTSALKDVAYSHFIEENSYTTDGGYFSLLSTIDNLYFDNDIREINRFIPNPSKNKSERAAVGGVMYALSFYNAYSDDVSIKLEINKRTAYNLLNIADASRRKAVHNDNSGCVLMIIFIISMIIFFVFIAPQLPSEQVQTIFTLLSIVKLIIFLVNKATN